MDIIENELLQRRLLQHIKSKQTLCQYFSQILGDIWRYRNWSITNLSSTNPVIFLRFCIHVMRYILLKSCSCSRITLLRKHLHLLFIFDPMTQTLIFNLSSCLIQSYPFLLVKGSFRQIYNFFQYNTWMYRNTPGSVITTIVFIAFSLLTPLATISKHRYLVRIGFVKDS
jgi:hypothetical protein